MRRGVDDWSVGLLFDIQHRLLLGNYRVCSRL
jgi:hypothetical protein